MIELEWSVLFLILFIGICLRAWVLTLKGVDL